MSKPNFYQDFIKGLWRENPVFRLLLGMCPTLAITTSALNGLSMGCAVIFVLIFTGLLISPIRKFIPNEVRIPVFTVIIATGVTLADYFLAARFPGISKSLGPYVPLIVVNCIILCRAEAFFSKNTLVSSLSDALGMGLGFTLSLILLGGIREILGSGTIFNYAFLGAGYEPWVVMLLPPGAFITLGLLVGLMNEVSRNK